MANNINLRLNKSFDRFSEGFSLPSSILMPLNTNKLQKEDDSFISEKKPQENLPQNTTKPDITLPENNHSEPSSEQNPQNKKPLGKIVFYSMLVTAGTVLLLTKGLSGSTADKIKRMADKWENNLLRKASKNSVAKAIDSTITKTTQKAKRLFSLSDAIANYTALKDTVFRKLTSWFKPVQRFFDFLTKNVLKITYGAVDTKYKTAGTALDGLEARFRNALAHSEKAAPEQISRITTSLDKINPLFHEGFSKSARNTRLSNVHNGLSNLADEVSSRLASPFKRPEKKGIKAFFKNFFKKLKENYSSYVTPTLAEPTQIKHKQAIDTAKKVLSNEISDVSMKLQNSANELKHCLSPGDTESRLIFGDLLEKIDTYKGLSGSKEKLKRGDLQQEIISVLRQIKEKIGNYIYTDKKGNITKYSDEEIKKITDLISGMQDTMTASSEKGLLQNILTEIKPLISEKEYKSLKAGVRHVNGLINDAVEAEGNNMFNKIAESKVGSIPTDMLGLGLLGGTGIYTVSKGKDKNEKISATLKVGIPLLGTIGTYFYTAAKAFSGTKNLIFSIVTGFALNRIGDAIYNYYQKRYVENKTVTEIVQDTYNDVTKT